LTKETGHRVTISAKPIKYLRIELKGRQGMFQIEITQDEAEALAACLKDALE
jgi:hypothetical protein